MDALDQDLLDVGSTAGSGDEGESTAGKFGAVLSLNLQKQLGHVGEDLLRRCQDDVNGRQQTDLAAGLRSGD